MTLCFVKHYRPSCVYRQSYYDFFFSMARQLYVGLGLIIVAWRSHSRHTTLGSTPLDGWSAFRREFPWHHTTPTWERHPCREGIRTRSFRGGGVKLPGPEVDLGPPFSTKAKSGCSCTSASHAFLHGIDKDFVTFTLVNAQKYVDNCHVYRPGEGQT